MKRNFSVYLLNLIFFLNLNLFGQLKEIDTLAGIEYMDLFKITNKKKSREEKDNVLKYIIRKAKKEKNRKFLMISYHAMAIIHKEELMLKYCDSIIQKTKDNPDESYPLEAYQLIGGNYYRKQKYKEALDYYLIVKNYANQFNDDYQIFHSNYNIGIIKRKIKEYKSAIYLYQENFRYAKENQDKIDVYTKYISIAALANIYNDLGEPDSASFYNRIGIKEFKDLDNKKYFNHFSLNEAVSQYHRGEYKQALDSLIKYTRFFEKLKSKKNLSIAYFYIGNTYVKLDNEEKAVLYYKKLDTIFQIKQSIFPLTRKGYEYLIDYYEKKGDLKNQLLYINNLLKVDSVLHAQEIYINKKMLKEYDIPKLAAEKETILQQLKTEKNNTSYIIYATIIIVLILIILLYLQYLKRKTYKKRFEELLKDKSDGSTYKEKEVKESKIEIPDSIVNEIMKSLEKFEKENLYISNKITLAKLAKEINTNTQYLSKVVNHFKGKTFSNYLNELRINYITEKLKEDTQLRRFTIKAISEESGFNNAESFSKAFYKVNGIRPSYFLKELDKR
ncbi:helix-turn-helix domain-containing protein [Tenacibaculum xiamenense]|uniref:helix-turn-helix domain-containing protein n=1 Tax=Tenacibaculum xiamenense TaxID=1261553 RepID=UPI0038956C10